MRGHSGGALCVCRSSSLPQLLGLRCDFVSATGCGCGGILSGSCLPRGCLGADLCFGACLVGSLQLLTRRFYLSGQLLHPSVGGRSLLLQSFH